MGAVPESNNYYELVPKLYKLSKENSIYGNAASELLRTLTEQEVLDPVHLGAYINEFEFNPKYNISDDKLTNFVLNFMLTTNRSWEDTKTKLPWDQTLAPNSVI